MVFGTDSRRNIILWQLSFILLATTWLWAPSLNHLLSYRTALISQYEAAIQPYSWLFRIGDVLGAFLLIALALDYLRDPRRKLASYLLLIIGTGMFIDPLIATTCHLKSGSCQEYFSASFLVHAIETVVTALAFLAIGIYDVWLRRRLISIGFVTFQVAYFGLFLSQLASQDKFNTLSQYIYQLTLIVWLTWFARDFLAGQQSGGPSQKEVKTVRYAVAGWAFLNGLLAILISLAHIHLLGKVRGIYFASDNAWLAQHGVIVGVLMLYLSRQLLRGELRARQIFLWLTALEALKYSVLTPVPSLMFLYLLTFCGLFVLRDDFDRGVIAMTLKVRLKDSLFMLGALLIASLVILGVLFRNHQLSDITSQSIDHFVDYSLRSEIISKSHLRSALLAHTLSAFLLMSLATILWILFKPSKVRHRGHDYSKVTKLLQKYSSSSEDYFKLWPKDKQYFWAEDGEGFIAYKTVGSTIFALADPVGAKDVRPKLINQFSGWARARRLKSCFLPIYPASLKMYEAANLSTLQIGASALIKIDKFMKDTARDKWWRWQKNRASRNGYQYSLSQPPHSDDFLSELRQISDLWLSRGGHQERGFALGYFDKNYLQDCLIHYLTNQDGQVVAFTNQLPLFNPAAIATVDLLRYAPEAAGTMPYLLLKTIEKLQEDVQYQYFDLGFVPFTAAKDPVVALARILSTGRFSAHGLEQFKNKFEPEWQPNYLAYDGDLGDLALIALNLEKVMQLKVKAMKGV